MIVWLKRWVWPKTFRRRFLAAMLFHQPLLFLVSLAVGWVKQLPLPVTMLEVWVWLFTTGTVVSLGQAAIARPGASWWKPLVSADLSEQ